jgi:hypothetical protein
VYNPKPDININLSADPFYQATQKHFADLFAAYGSKIYVLNLIKGQNPREGTIADEYKTAVQFINKEMMPSNKQLAYIHHDMKAMMKRDQGDFLSKTSGLAHFCILKTGMFMVTRAKKKGEQRIDLQRGVIRSNCIDCLDRTNVHQQIVGEVALNNQLSKLYSRGGEDPGVKMLDEKILAIYRGLYERMGDYLSLQYGGSIAHKSKIYATSTNIEFITSIKRHFNNSFNDQYKQNQIDLFLGLCNPKKMKQHLWEKLSWEALNGFAHQMSSLNLTSVYLDQQSCQQTLQ